MRDGSEESTTKPQHHGINQGCPLSPFLFGMLMTVLMMDARVTLGDEAKNACDKGELENTFFADDTLLIRTLRSHIEEYIAAVKTQGGDYGLQIHSGKVCLLRTGTLQQFETLDGSVLQRVTQCFICVS